jgi:hypothetical protein
MQKIEFTLQQMILIGMGIGAVLGLIPLALGIYKGKKKFAFLGFVAAAAAGAIWSLLALVPVVLFIWLILRTPGPAAAAGVNEEPGGARIEDLENR